MNSRFTLFGLLFLAFAVAMAWIGALQAYYPNGDEYLYLGWIHDGLSETLRDHLGRSGLQRVLGTVWVVWLLALPMTVIGWVSIGTHFIAVALLFQTARVLTRSAVIALFIAIIWGVYPLGYYAILWSTGTYAVLHFSLALIAFLVLFRHCVRPFRLNWLPYALSAVALLTAGFIGEYLVFAFPLLGLLALCAVREYRLQDWRTLVREPLLWWPLIVTVAFLALLALSKPHGVGSVEDAKVGDLNWRNINPRSLLSVWYYQHTGLFMLQPWKNGEAWRVAFQTWTPLMKISVAVLGVLSIGLLWAFSREASATPAKSEKPPLTLGLVVLALLPAVSFVHVLAGGYKGDSRHNYIPAAMGLLFLGWVIARFVPRVTTSPRLVFGAALAVLAFAVVTNWLTIGVFRYETRRHQALIQFMFDQQIHGPVQLQYEPPLYSVFPLMPRTLSHGFNEDWPFDWALAYLRTKHVDTRNLSQVSVTNAPGIPLVTISGAGPEFTLKLRGMTNGSAVVNP